MNSHIETKKNQMILFVFEIIFNELKKKGKNGLRKPEERKEKKTPETKWKKRCASSNQMSFLKDMLKNHF